MLPVALGNALLFVDRAQRRLYSIDYDFLQNWYATTNKNVASEHLTVPGYQQLVFQRAIPDILWAVRQDGRFIGLTY